MDTRTDKRRTGCGRRANPDVGRWRTGWWVFVQEAWQAPGNVGALLTRLPHDYTIRQTGFRFGNVVTTLLIPQRGINLALPLAVVVFRQWWLAAHDAGGRPNESVRRMLAAGLMAGLLPLIHGHTLHGRRRNGGAASRCCFQMWPAWIAFVVVAAGLGMPQLLWLAKGSAVDSASFVGWQFGWDRGETGAVVFWLMNTGALIPIIVWVLMARGESNAVPAKLRRFYLPFLLCFVVPNVVRLAPSIWDNIKVLVVLVSRLDTARVPRALAGLSRWRLAARTGRRAPHFANGRRDPQSVACSLERCPSPGHDSARDRVCETHSIKTESNATVLHAPTFNHSVGLSGRRSLMGYPGHLWSQGLDFAAREREIRQMYAGGPDATRLFAQHSIDYVVIGADERRFSDVNDAFFARYPVVARHGPYHLYRVRSAWSSEQDGAVPSVDAIDHTVRAILASRDSLRGRSGASAAILRLDLKPFHHDEGVNGWFLLNLVRPPHRYRYDPANYHGPTLYFLGIGELGVVWAHDSSPCGWCPHFADY